MNKITKISIFSLLLILLSCNTGSQQEAGIIFDRAVEAWDRGDYIQSLQGFKDLLSQEEADNLFDEIALITGELYPVSEIAPDGQNIRFSSDGAYAVYEVTQDESVVTKIVSLDKSEKSVQTITAKNLVLSEGGDQAVYLVPKKTESAQKAFEEARALTGREQSRALAQAETDFSAIAIRHVESGEEKVLDTGELLVTEPFFGTGSKNILFTGWMKNGNTSSSIYEYHLESGTFRRLTSDQGFAQNPSLGGNRILVYRISSRNPFDRAFRRTPGASPDRVALLDLKSGRTRTYTASSFVLDEMHMNLAYIQFTEGTSTIFHMSLEDTSEPKKIHETANRLSDLSFSPLGEKITFSEMIDTNWEIFVVDTHSSILKRVTSEIQHDRLGRMITENLLLGIKGEGRHQRSYLYNLETGNHIRLFHNNTLRTVAPEYEWAVHPEGKKILFVSDRDGDTMSPERGMYLMNLENKISHEALTERIEICLAGEQDLRRRGERMFSPISSDVEALVSEVSERRIYEIESRMSSFGSKYITEPGNAQARDFLLESFKSYGYEPQLQWFEARGVKTANILATLEGTKNPERIYVLSSHFDSNRRSPGADDNTSATAVTLEAARILRNHPQRATIIFALFTGEEAGLLGSREFVAQAVNNKLNIIGALNNDMIGWCENNRMDNTIRYSNENIRDIQHAASFLFSDLITYDSRYIRSTDAAAYYEEFGDIVGGIGSYPILGSPFYHQATDRIETVNFHLIGEVAKSTIAALMFLASSAAPINEQNTENPDK